VLDDELELDELELAGLEELELDDELDEELDCAGLGDAELEDDSADP